MEKLNKFRFKDMLHFWSMAVVLSHVKVPYKSKYPLVALDTLLTQSGDRITLDPKNTYSQITVKTNGGGIVERDKVKKYGKDIKTRKQTLVKEGQFLFSKIDARNGAFGILPMELDEAVVTSEFPVFTINTEKVIPEFLLLVMTSEEMIAYIKSMSSGSTNRKRLDVATFLNILVPLPSMDEQKAIISEYNITQQKIILSELEQANLPENIQKEILKKTETNIKRNENKQRLEVLKFTDLESWSVENVLETLNVKSNYPMVRIGDWIRTFQKDEDGETLRVATKNYPMKDYLYVGMEDVEKNTGKMTGFKLKKGAEIKSGGYIVPEGHFIFGRLRPTLNKFWLNTSKEQNIVCSTEFFVFSLNKDVDTDYFECILSSDIVQEQIKKYLTGAGLPRINAVDFLHLMIPNPPADVKRQLGVYFKSMQKKMWAGHSLIIAEKERSKKLFESKIFE